MDSLPHRYNSNRRPDHAVGIGTRRIRERTNFTPRVRAAMRYYATGVARTHADAAAMCGVSPITVSTALYSHAGRAYMRAIQEQLANAEISAATMIADLGKQMVANQAVLALSADSEAIRMRATADLLDRNPETSKSQRNFNESFTIGARDVASLASALVQGAALRAKHAEAADGNYIRIPLEAATAAVPPAIASPAPTEVSTQETK